MRIWITRARPEADATAGRIRALGHEPVVAPVLDVQAGERAPDLAGVAALAFTSRSGVRAFAALSAMRRLPVFAVGDATAQAAREAGFSDVSSASGDVAALAALIARRSDALTGDLLYLAPEEPAGDLVGALRAQGVPARAEVVYRTVPAALAIPPADIDVVLIHSPKAARRLAEDPVLAASVAAMAAICISAKAAEPLHGLGLRDVLIAAAPNEAAMLELFQAWAASQPRPRLFTPLFWAVVGFGLACIAAAILVAGLGPRLMGLRVDRPATPTVQPLQIHKNSG